jgi:hypothetical protein
VVGCKSILSKLSANCKSSKFDALIGIQTEHEIHVWPAFRSARLAHALLRIDVMNIASIRGVFNGIQFHLAVLSQVVILSLLPALYLGQIVGH